LNLLIPSITVWSRGYAGELWCYHCSKSTVTAEILHHLRVFEPATQWMTLNNKSIELDPHATTIYEVVPDNLLLVTMWLEHHVGNNFVLLDESF